MSSIDDSLLTYSQIMTNQRNAEMETLNRMPQFLVNCIDENEADESEINGANERVNQILKNRSVCLASTGFYQKISKNS